MLHATAAGLVVAALSCSCIAASLTQHRRIHCSCRVDGFSRVQIDIGHGYLKAETNTQSRKGKKITCSKEERAFVPHGYELLAGVGLFKLHRAGAEQRTAGSRCREEGARLAVPQDPQEATALAALLKGAGVEAALTAITDRDNEGHFTTELGVSVTAALSGRWERRQPDNGGLALGREDCVVLTARARFNDVACQLAMPFLCHLPLHPVPSAGYQYVPGLGFYKRYTKPERYEEARRICEADGAHLAVPDTFQEAEELLKMAAGDGRSSYVGIDDIDNEGSFVTVTGHPISELEFNNWAPNEPNNFLELVGGEDCVELKAYGLLNDLHCAISLPFFCERALPDTGS